MYGANGSRRTGETEGRGPRRRAGEGQILVIEMSKKISSFKELRVYQLAFGLGTEGGGQMTEDRGRMADGR